MNRPSQLWSQPRQLVVDVLCGFWIFIVATIYLATHLLDALGLGG